MARGLFDGEDVGIAVAVVARSLHDSPELRIRLLFAAESNCIGGSFPRQERAWSLLVGVMMWLPAELDAFLERTAGLSHAEYQVLRWLSLSEDREVHMTRLAATASVTPSHLSRIVSRPESGGGSLAAATPSILAGRWRA